MFSANELADYLKHHGVNPYGIGWVERTRSSEPSRRVRPGFNRNSIFQFPSRKMEFTIQAESKVENSFLVEYEFDPCVLELWDQPEPVDMERCSGDKTRIVPYTADVLLLTQHGPRVVQIKSEDELRRLATEDPANWVQSDDSFQLLPANKAFEKYGLIHEVHSSARLNPIRQPNLRLLLTTREHQFVRDDHLITELDRVFKRTAVVTLSVIADALNLVDLTDILHLIDHGFLFSDLDKHLLGIRSSALLCRHRDLLDVVAQQSPNNILTASARAAERISFTNVPSEAAAKRGLQLLKLIDAGSKEREIYRVKRKMKARAPTGLSRLEAACPNYAGRGNRKKRISKDHETFIEKAIKEYYASEKKPTIRQAHIFYVARIATEGVPFTEVSCPTFKERILRVDPRLLGYRRGGRRMRNAAAPPTPISAREVNALYAFERCSIDHTSLRLAVIVAVTAKGKKITATVWVTAMVDHHTKMILGVWISFKDPSKQCVAMTIRMCARTFGLLPRMIIGDGGSALVSGYLKRLCAHYGATWSQHEQANGRAGSEVERIFALFETEWLPFRPGNLQNIESRRAISSSHSPESTAELWIRQVWEELILFVESQNSRTIGDMPEPARILMEKSLAAFPTVPVKAAYDDKLIFDTAVDCRVFALDRQRGIHINNRWFVHPKLFDPSFTKSSVQVRIEPENPYKIYAKVGTEWIVCLARGHDEFLQLSELDRQATSFRLILGESSRDKARISDKVDFVTRILKHEEQQKAAEKGAASSVAIGDTAHLAGQPRSLFDEVREIQLEPLKPGTQHEVINNVVAFRINSANRERIGTASQDAGNGGRDLHSAIDDSKGGDPMRRGPFSSWKE